MLVQPPGAYSAAARSRSILWEGVKKPRGFLWRFAVSVYHAASESLRTEPAPAATNATQEPTAQEKSVQLPMLPLPTDHGEAADGASDDPRASPTGPFDEEDGASDDENANDDENEEELDALLASVEIGKRKSVNELLGD